MECHALLAELAETCRTMAAATRSAPTVAALEKAGVEFDRLAAAVSPYLVEPLLG